MVQVIETFDNSMSTINLSSNYLREDELFPVCWPPQITRVFVVFASAEKLVLIFIGPNSRSKFIYNLDDFLEF